MAHNVRALQFFETSESIFTGPRIDHTRKSVYGRYLYASGLDSEGGDYYVIQSPFLDLSYSQGSEDTFLSQTIIRSRHHVWAVQNVRIGHFRDPNLKYKKLPWLLVPQYGQ